MKAEEVSEAIAQVNDALGASGLAARFPDLKSSVYVKVNGEGEVESFSLAVRFIPEATVGLVAAG